MKDIYLNLSIEEITLELEIEKKSSLTESDKEDLDNVKKELINKGYADENTSYSELDDIVVDITNEKETLEKDINDVKESLVENELIEEGTPNDLIPEQIEEGVKKLKGQSSPPVDNGPIYEGKYRVRYFDLDGKVLKIEYVADGGRISPPQAPKYDPDYLIFDEWNYDASTYIVEQPTDIGATYKTVDDVTYLFCRFTSKTGLNHTINITGYISIDWGDGNVDTNTSHTYANEGEYLIKISGDFTFTTSAYTDLFNSAQKSSAIEKIYLKSNFGTLLPEYCFGNLQGLNYISLPKNITTIPAGCFINNYNLKFFVVPRNANFNKTTFRDCRTIRGVVLNTKITELYTDCFVSCYNLQFLITPINVVYIKNTAFKGNYNLNELIIPKKTTSIGKQVCTNCTPKNIFVFVENVPTLGNYFNNNFYGYEIMWVNDSIIEQLKVATNWSDYATMMKPLSWYPSLTDPNA